MHVDLPKDILVKETELIWPEKVAMRSYNPNYDGHPGPDQAGGPGLVRAKQPVLYVGGGVISADASAELRELAELTQIPVTTTLMGLGAFPSEHPLVAGDARACTGPTTRTWPCTTPTCWWRWAPASTTG